MSSANTNVLHPAMRPDRRSLQPRRRYVSENNDSTYHQEDLVPLSLSKPWVSVTKLFSAAQKKIIRTKSSSSYIRDDSSISGHIYSKPTLLKTSLVNLKKHTDGNAGLQEFMQDVLHVMKHGSYPPTKNYAAIIEELRQVLAAPGGPDTAQRLWYGHLLPRLAALLTQPITSISTLTERVHVALALWSNLYGCLAPLLQALWQPLPGMRVERDAVTVFRRYVLPLVSLRRADGYQRNKVIATYKRRLVAMLLLCSRLSWCYEDCCSPHDRLKDISLEDQLRNLDKNTSLFASSGNTDGKDVRNGNSSHDNSRQHKAPYQKTSAPSGYLHCRNYIIENIDENDELVLQDRKQNKGVFQDSKVFGNSISSDHTSCPAHLATLSTVDSNCFLRERIRGGSGTDRLQFSTEMNGNGFNGSHDPCTDTQYGYTSTRNYDLSAELGVLLAGDQASGSAFILANLTPLLRLHHQKE